MKRAALTQLALHPNTTAMAQHQFLGDMQSQSKALAARCKRLFHLIQTVKYFRRIIGVHAVTGIADRDTDKALIFFTNSRAHRDTAVLGREFDRVVDQISENLLESLRVGMQQRQVIGNFFR